ncbi:MAG: hypothetical protein EPN74_17405 [Rhodanobacter sp.]|nr:MAG: hypothetical protein EPN74_17405 [Rhodanobacter sp.]
MTDASPTPAWPRPYWQPSDEKALLQFYVFGKFEQELQIPSPRYGSPGLPEGVEIQRFQNAVLRKWDGYPLNGALGDVLREDSPQAFELSRIAPEVLVLRGEIADGESLDYLRNTLGVLAGLLDTGGSTILDPQILGLFGAEHWRRHYLVEGGAPSRHHVLILCNADDVAGHSWIRTRGMRKFGRPDLSIRNVPERAVDRAGLLCEWLVELQSLGAHFSDGQSLDVEGLPGGLVVRLGGSRDDAHFNNSHVELRWAD